MKAVQGAASKLFGCWRVYTMWIFTLRGVKLCQWKEQSIVGCEAGCSDYRKSTNAVLELFSGLGRRTGWVLRSMQPHLGPVSSSIRRWGW